ncbi:hypothetical protein [Spirosoma gilvum]
MKTILFFAMTVVVFSSCSNQSTPIPANSSSREAHDDNDFASKVEGAYLVSIFNKNKELLHLPTPTISATVKSTKIDNNHIELEFTLNRDGQTESTNVSNVKLSVMDANRFAMMNGTDSLGIVTSNYISFTGNAFFVRASR